MEEQDVLDLVTEFRSLCHRLKSAIDTNHQHKTNLAKLLKACLTKLENTRDLVDRVLLVTRKAGEGPVVFPSVLVRWKDRLASSFTEAQSEADSFLGPTTLPPTPASASASASAPDSTTPSLSSACALEAATLTAAAHATLSPLPSTSIPPSHTAFSWTVPTTCPTPPSHTAFSFGRRTTSVSSSPRLRLAALRDVTSAIRHLEQSMDFQRDLVADVMAVTGRSDVSYSRDNFAYGSTPFQTWRALFHLPPLQAVLPDCVPTASSSSTTTSPVSGPHTAVFGSSHGLLAFNAALYAGVRTVGYELLPSMVRHATALQDHHHIPSSDLCFIEGDMLATADLTHCRLVVLTSQCWDADLCAAVYAKLDAEAQPGCVVVDYLSGLQSAGTSFKLTTTHSAPVSWGDSLRFHIYTKQ